jgi:hypothetical protein
LSGVLRAGQSSWWRGQMENEKRTYFLSRAIPATQRRRTGSAPPAPDRLIPNEVLGTTRPAALFLKEDPFAMDLQRFLIGLGLVILAVGVLWPILSRIGLGRLPGDIMFQRGGATFYFPLVTSIIVSIVLTALLWLFNR